LEKRQVDLVVISDVHLGTYGSHAFELLEYLKSINPKILILNGDIIDGWQFKKSYFPKVHLDVIKKILDISLTETQVYYLTGNHDEFLRKFTDYRIGNISILNKVVLDIDGKKAWFFHGDVFDATIIKAKWLAKLGGWGYDVLIIFNRLVNNVLSLLKKPPYSLSKKIKGNVKSAVKFITNFETTCVELAIENQYSYVICGHIHEPKIQYTKTEKGEVVYLNSGDWIENLTALEFHNGEWTIYNYREIYDQQFKKKDISCNA
jgi:UDP-2,3-diacylglucosamine pyrophosphatase LpxH